MNYKLLLLVTLINVNWGNLTALATESCQNNEQCEDNHICEKGICVPRPEGACKFSKEAYEQIRKWLKIGCSSPGCWPQEVHISRMECEIRGGFVGVEDSARVIDDKTVVCCLLPP